MWQRLRSISPAGQLLVLFVIFLANALLADLVSSLIIGLSFTQEQIATLSQGDMDASMSNAVQLISLVNQLFWFGVTAWLFTYIQNQSIPQYFGFGRKVHPYLAMGGVLLFLSLVIPILNMTAFTYEAMRSAGGIWGELLAQDAMRDQSHEILLTAQGFSETLWVMVVFAVVPGIMEEFIFRGILVRKAYQISGNIHVAVWTVAVLFALLHLQPAKLPAMLTLGAVLGYLYVLSGNLIASILFHIGWNALNIQIHWASKDSFETSWLTPDIGLLIASLAVLLTAVFMLRRFGLVARTQEVWREPKEISSNP